MKCDILVVLRYAQTKKKKKSWINVFKGSLIHKIRLINSKIEINISSAQEKLWCIFLVQGYEEKDIKLLVGL